MPRPNYVEESDSEQDESFISVASNISQPVTPLSPSNPNFLLQVTPLPTRQVLTDVADTLAPLEAIQAIVPNWAPVVSEEETVEGQIVESVQNLKVGDPGFNMPDNVIVNFEDEDGKDDNRALQEACSQLAKHEWDDDDLDFFFNQAEIVMASVGVKKNFTKFQVLSRIIPKKVINEVKPLLRRKETDFPDKNAYRKLKDEVTRIFGPKPEVGVEKALSRVLTGKPSTLARTLVNDLNKDLNCANCCAVISTLWKRQLPGSVRAGIARYKLSAANFEEVCQAADDIFESNTAKPVVAAVQVGAPSLDETQPGIQYPVPEVAAVRGRGGGSNRGNSRGRGGRGRGGRGGRGGQTGNSQNNQQTQAAGNNRHKGPRHPDIPPGEWSGCGVHYRNGKNAYFCAEPATCPWKNIFKPRD